MIPPPVDVLRAAEVARAHHRWQDDGTGRPYFEAHVVEVHRRVVHASTAVQAVALLHGVLEGTGCTEDELRREFPGHVVDAVVALTGRRGEPPADHYARVRADGLAREVALVDLAVRTGPDRLAELDGPTAAALTERCRLARALLGG